MKRELQENEFFGEVASFCEDERKIYFFDEISHGLFYIDKDTCNVGLLVAPDEFISSGNFPVFQLIKFNDNIYIIPTNMKFGWRIFNLTKKHLDVIFPFERNEITGNVTGTGNILYIVPTKTNRAFAKFDMVTGKAEVILENWYDGNEPKECWGYSVYSDTVVFPIIGTNEIVYFKDEKVKKIDLFLDEGITSVCLDSDGLWILPESGGYIYNADRKKGFSKVNITGEGVSFRDYVRIISVEEFIILLPKTDSNILIYKKKKKEWICIEINSGDRFRFLFRQFEDKTIPFWGWSFSAPKLRFLPQGYRFAEIDLETGKMEFKVMNCGEGFTAEQYNEWAKYNSYTSRKDVNPIFQEEVFGRLSDFIRYI